MKKKILLATVSSVVTLVVAFLAAEIYLRYKSGPVSPPDSGFELYTHDGRKVSTYVGSMKLTLDSFTFYSNFPSQHTPTFNINSAGLRAEEGVERDQLPKIAFLGGSAAFGFGTKDRETIPSIMEASVKSHHVLNAGVIGFFSGQELTHLVTRIINYRPAVVVVYDGWNDLFGTVYIPERNESELGFNQIFFQVENQLAEKHETDRSARQSFSRFVGLAAGKSRVLDRFERALESQPARRPADRRLLDAVVENYVANLRKMSLFSHAAGAEFIVVMQPELGQKSYRTPEEEQLLKNGFGPTIRYDQFPDLYREFRAKAKAGLTREGVEWIDINDGPAFQDSRDTLFTDVVHTNRRGNEIIAELIMPRLQTLLKSKNNARSEPRSPGTVERKHHAGK
jgi:lysophospholipase L1-like esterase